MVTFSLQKKSAFTLFLIQHFLNRLLNNHNKKNGYKHNGNNCVSNKVRQTVFGVGWGGGDSHKWMQVLPGSFQ